MDHARVFTLSTTRPQRPLLQTVTNSLAETVDSVKTSLTIDTSPTNQETTVYDQI